MKHYINTETEKGGKILGFCTSRNMLKTGVNIEVSNTQYVQAHKHEENNTITIDGDNMSFSKVEYPKSDEELKAKQLAEAYGYLASTDFYMTVDKYATLTDEKKTELTTKRQEARDLINSLEGAE